MDNMNYQTPNQQVPNQQIANQNMMNQQMPNQNMMNQQMPNQNMVNQQMPNQNMANQQVQYQRPYYPGPNGQMPYPGYPNPNVNAFYEKKKEEKAQNAERFAKLAAPTLLFAVLYTLFMYKNFANIGFTLATIAMVAYCFIGLRVVGKEIKGKSFLFAIGICLCGLSSFLTDSAFFHVFNFIGAALLCVCLLMYNCFDTSSWKLSRYIANLANVFVGHVSNAFGSFEDLGAFSSTKEKKKQTKLAYVMIGIACAIPLVVVICILLYSADAVFAEMIENILRELNIWNIFWIVIMFIVVFAVAYALLRYLAKSKIESVSKDHRKYEPIIANTILIIVSLVYIIFCSIQIMYLFIGNMELPEGYNYAEYAREGFFQLLIVCVLNIAIVLFFMGLFRKHVLTDILLTLISVCTYVMLASCAMRMSLYIEAYNLTLSRILVLWAVIMLALLLPGVIIQVFNDKFSLFHYGVTMITIGYLVLSFARCDYWIATYNINNENAEGIDYAYLVDLSADAAPAIVDLDEDKVTNRYSKKLHAKDDKETLRSFNLSRFIAKELL